MNPKVKALIDSGVQIEDPASLFVEDGVSVAAGVTLGPNVILKGGTRLARGVCVEGSAYLKDTTVDEDAVIKFSVRCEGAIIGRKAAVGPFAHLRPGAVLEEEAKVGNFVEVKKGRLKKGAKASHLAYLGDCTVGAHANIGAGTITCNYDGRNKHETRIGDHAFIGSNTCLVAPVSVGEGASVGAGSVITKDVEAHALALTRPPQVSRPGWSKRKKQG